MKIYLEKIENELSRRLAAMGSRPAALCEAMRYAVGSGGKRIRPLICLFAAEAVGAAAECALPAAAAIELLHNYTLVHDDLPAMDNDVERRGKPTVWKKYGEANAILIGDCLQAAAFAAAADCARNAAAISATLARYAVGVVCGQVEDIEPERRDIAYIYEHKTSDLFCAAAVMGALAGGGSEADVERLRTFALHLGLAFQFEDDLLDGDSPFGREETERLAKEHTVAATAALTGLAGDATRLRALAEKLLGRSE